MKPQTDRILEGVLPSELAQLQALAAGKAMREPLRPLEDKGWVETVAGIPLITLTGRTLLDGSAAR